MLNLYFNEKCDYSEENTSDNEDFGSTIYQQFQFESEQKKTCGNESHEKEIKHIYTSNADLLLIRIGKTKREIVFVEGEAGACYFGSEMFPGLFQDFMDGYIKP